jgi:sugar fermentation stimulation protein A
MFYKFEKPLIEATIKSRPNRFIMIVDVKGKIEKCHCPCTGRIGNVVFENIPCLLSESTNKERATKYTVEAISLDNPKLKTIDKKWIGINQTKSNNYIEYFFKQNAFDKIISKGEKIKHEQRLGKSRIDFKIDNNYIEVKTPLTQLPESKFIKTKEHGEFNSFDRIIKHFEDLTNDLQANQKAITIMCYQFDAPKFVVPKLEKANAKIIQAAKQAHIKGLETWQVNLIIDSKRITLGKYFKLNLF